MRSTSFGTDAERYDRARPTYPAELVDRLLADPQPREGARRVLDVGCGTGKSGRLFRERGCEVLGVEVDERMAAVARGHGLEVDVAPFEEWEPRGREFELAVCGQAWHWLDAERALATLAECLVPGGRFAAFWNLGRPEAPFADDLAAAYREHAPELEEENSVLFGGIREDLSARYFLPIEAARGFGGAVVWTFPWHRRYTRDEWVDLLRTQSDHILLPDERREALLGDLAATIDARGGELDVPFVTAVITAVRTAES